MNNFINVLLWIILIVPQVGNTVIAQTDTMREQKEQPENLILSKNYEVAKKALEKAVSERDKTTIRLGLKRKSLPFKKEVVDAIIQLADKSFVPDLIRALEENQTSMSGGTETELFQQALNKAIISALEKFTQLRFSYLSEESTLPCFYECPTKEIKRVLTEVKKWCVEHRSDLESN